MMSDVTTEAKFQAAVNVIKNLPNDGPYQPSNDMKLRFYSHFKQATEGPCSDPKPAFWEVIKKAKWDAWKCLGQMSKEDAMNNYIEDLKKIIETMSYSENVADFVDKLGPFYEMVDITLPTKKLEKNGGVKKKKSKNVGNGTANEDGVKENGLRKSPSSTGATPRPINSLSTQLELVLRNEESKDQTQNKANGIHKDIKNEKSDWKDPDSALHVSGTFAFRDSYSEKFYSGTESDDDEFSDPVQNDDSEYKMLSPLPLETVANYSDNASGTSEQALYEEKRGQVWTFFPFRRGQKDSLADNVDEAGTMNGFQYETRETDCGSDFCGKELKNRVSLNQESTNSPIDGVVRHGGGDLTAPASAGRLHRGSGRQSTSHLGKAYVGGSLESLSSAGRLSTTGSGGGHRRGPGPGRDAGDVNEQIAETLFQLQKDMESVLIRLNTLEALTVAHHNIAQGRMVSVLPAVAEKKSSFPSWWPFTNMSFETVAIFLAWPIVLQVVIYFVMAQRARRLARCKRP